MNEIQNIDALTTEILILKQQTAQNIIEIGKRLVSVKESLPHGEWGKYLEEKVDVSQWTANKFMKVAKENSNCGTFNNLNQSKVFALLSLPQEDRETFVKENPVNEMTTRELQKAIKERDKAVKEKNNAENKFQTYQAQLDQARIDEKQLEDDKQIYESKLKAMESALQKEKDNSKKKIEDLQTFIGEAKANGDNEEVIRLQASLKEVQTDLDSSAQKIDELEAQLKEKTIDVITAEPVIVEKVPEEIEKELQDLRQKAMQSGNNSVIRFKIYFAELQKIFRDELEVMAEIKETDPEMNEKCTNAISVLISKMSERL
ncbi:MULTISPECIES: DUF3102 domain-containing protein [Clostridium]|uniref:DUF3102 domain-containing protein n=1 Tax=Clostridium frigoriphilum TaxID=443253 RepID=A0ABU7UJ68_9CLOT|nr:DUF3102 domain-containing protein [Clostridium sp. DSM 17811]MBU3098360.1 DUF3102 domain-containing protein [Clostridium sp. DSM 17811]